MGPEERRIRAEELPRVRNSRTLQDARNDPTRLVHELEVHQIELEMQNEELRAARSEIERGLERYTELFDFAPIGYFAVAGDGTIRDVNLAAARLLRTERQRLMGRYLVLFVLEEDRPGFRDFLTRLLPGDAVEPRTETCEASFVSAENDRVVLRLTGTTLTSRSPAVLIAAEDITAQKHAEDALRLENRNKDEFIAALSHELRNPLAPIRNSLGMLQRVAPGGDQALKAQAVIDRQVTHLTRIVDDLLDVTRIARGKLRLQREKVDLADLVKHTLDDHRPIFEATGLRMSMDICSESLWINADATRLVQVVGNLLVNSSKFTSRGGDVSVSVRKSGQQALLSVRDTGVGIDPTMRERLFEAFTQAPQHLDRPRGGLGLGLAMVKGLVELHGGTVSVQSPGLGRGSEFIIRLPLDDAPAVATPPAEEAPLRHHKLLVIEDNVDVAESLKDVLELEGHEVKIAFDGPEGISAARAFLPEIVICDIGLPGIDGYGVARAFRADEILRGTYLIALTGYATPEDGQRCIDAGFDCHIAKPPTVEKLERLFAQAPPPSPYTDNAELIASH